MKNPDAYCSFMEAGKIIQDLKIAAWREGMNRWYAQRTMGSTFVPLIRAALNRFRYLMQDKDQESNSHTWRPGIKNSMHKTLATSLYRARIESSFSARRCALETQELNYIRQGLLLDQLGIGTQAFYAELPS